MAVSQDRGTRGTWRFWSALTLYCICWVVALLSGLRVLPHVNQLLLYLGMPGWFLGQGMESWMLWWSRPDADTERFVMRPFSLGSMYIVPIVLAVTVPVLGWTLWLSILCFAGLMARVGWHYAQRSAN